MHTSIPLGRVMLCAGIKAMLDDERMKGITPLGSEPLGVLATDDERLDALGDKIQRDLLGSTPFVTMHPDTDRWFERITVERVPLGVLDVRHNNLMPPNKYLLWDGHRLTVATLDA